MVNIGRFRLFIYSPPIPSDGGRANKTVKWFKKRVLDGYLRNDFRLPWVLGVTAWGKLFLAEYEGRLTLSIILASSRAD